jgi:hypothetical protein
MRDESNLVIDPVYTLHDFYRNRNGNYIVVAKEESNPRGVFKVAATDLVTSKKIVTPQVLLT